MRDMRDSTIRSSSAASSRFAAIFSRNKDIPSASDWKFCGVRTNLTLARMPVLRSELIAMSGDNNAQLEAEVAKLRQEITAAIAAQEQLHAQLTAAIEKLSQLPAQRPAISDKNQAIQIGRLESRMRSVEQRVERVNGQVAGILESRIWKTLVKSGSLFLRFVR